MPNNMFDFTGKVAIVTGFPLPLPLPVLLWKEWESLDPAWRSQSGD